MPKQGGFKSFLTSEQGHEKQRQSRVTCFKSALEVSTYLPAAKTTLENAGDLKAGSLHAGWGSMQGWRSANEDAQIVEKINLAGAEEPVLVMGMFDGHGGAEVAARVAGLVPGRLRSVPCDADMAEHLPKLFTKLDEDLREKAETFTGKAGTTGSTANVVIIDDKRYVCANAGDCRAVLCRGNEAFPLSTDHSPDDPGESKRVTTAGSEVTEGRVEGMLNVSRAFGDFDLKRADLRPEEQAITASCDVTETAREVGNDKFIVQACDGIWGSLSDQEAVDAIREARSTKPPATPQEVAEILCKKCLSSTGDGAEGTDNMSVNICFFL
ncbi:Protein phosphatase 2C-like protein 2 [Diplonema papillatum]|nr:Protein phosphatase 2C-like protein 2 [Diplonema papillatum]|eukprot:gene15022-22932_t